MALSTLDQKKIDRIKQELRWHPAGMTISALSSKMKMNRNLLAKYLDTLLISGQVTIQITGTAKVYSLSQRVPFNDVLDFITEAVIILDNDLQILRVNESLLALLQVEREVLVGKKIDSSGHPFLSGLPLPRLQNRQVFPAGTAFETTGIIRDRSVKIRIRPIPVVFDNGSKGTVLILEGNAARTDATPYPDPAVTRFEGIIEDQTEFIIRFLPDGTLTFVSDSFSHYFRNTPDALIGRPVFSFLLTEDREQVAMRLRSLNPGHPSCSLEHRVLGPSVTPRWHRWTYMALFDDKGEIREYLCTGRDISDRCETTEQINQYIADQYFLYRSSHAFANAADDAGIYDTIARGVREILPEAFVIVNTFEPTLHSLTTRSCIGEKERDVFSRELGREIVGMSMEAPDSIELGHVNRNLMGGKLVKVPGNLYVMMLGLVPQAICQKIEEALNIGDMYVIGLVSRNVLYGNVLIFLRKGDVLQHEALIEIFIRQATMALKLRLAEQAPEGRGIAGIPGVPSAQSEPEHGVDEGDSVISNTGISGPRR
jgi:PAS domain S-box-containing protein